MITVPFPSLGSKIWSQSSDWGRGNSSYLLAVFSLNDTWIWGTQKSECLLGTGLEGWFVLNKISKFLIIKEEILWHSGVFYFLQLKFSECILFMLNINRTSKKIVSGCSEKNTKNLKYHISFSLWRYIYFKKIRHQTNNP